MQVVGRMWASVLMPVQEAGSPMMALDQMSPKEGASALGGQIGLQQRECSLTSEAIAVHPLGFRVPPHVTP